MTTRTVTIPARQDHEGYHSIVVNLAWRCPVCGGPRGEPFSGLSFDGSRRLEVDQWHNLCGHIDKYADVRQEAAENGLNRVRLEGGEHAAR